MATFKISFNVGELAKHNVSSHAVECLVKHHFPSAYMQSVWSLDPEKRICTALWDLVSPKLLRYVEVFEKAAFPENTKFAVKYDPSSDKWALYYQEQPLFDYLEKLLHPPQKVDYVKHTFYLKNGIKIEGNFVWSNPQELLPNHRVYIRDDGGRLTIDPQALVAVLKDS